MAGIVALSFKMQEEDTREKISDKILHIEETRHCYVLCKSISQDDFDKGLQSANLLHDL